MARFIQAGFPTEHAGIDRFTRGFAAVRGLDIWDYTPYGVHPGSDWVAIDRTAAAELLAALAGVDHWQPWSTPIEARPQP